MNLKFRGLKYLKEIIALTTTIAITHWRCMKSGADNSGLSVDKIYTRKRPSLSIDLQNQLQRWQNGIPMGTTSIVIQNGVHVGYKSVADYHNFSHYFLK